MAEEDVIRSLAICVGTERGTLERFFTITADL